MKCPKCHSDNPSDSGFCSKCGTQLLPSEEISAPTETLEAAKEELTRGTTFAGRYEIIEELGKGGMGKVYRVEDKKIKEEVALKLIKPDIASDKKTIERFSNELKMSRKIAHRNVCKMYDLGEEKGTHYITMEYVPGEDLKSFIRRAGTLSAGKTIFIAKQVCEGLSEAHRLGVVHRDLKPQNIMIDKEGNARIMDFGIARSIAGKGITGAGVMIGTPEYMSPEQAEVKEVDQRSDIYSLGVILYEMVTGRVPFEGETPLGIAMKHKSEVPKDPKELNTQMPEDLSRVILRCMEKDKEKRYQNAGEVRSELENIEKGIPTTERVTPERKPITSKEITVKFTLKKIFIPALVVITFVIAVVIIWSPWAQKESAPITVDKPSIAVLPFEDLSPQQDQAYFCDGIAAELINRLTKIETLKVPARASSFSFKEKELDIKEIGNKLKVESLLVGSLQKAGNRLRITVELVKVSDGYPLWSEKYERNMEDIFALQDEISLAIVDNLKIELLGEEKAELVTRHTQNPEAYNLYLKGRFFWNKRTAKSMEKSLEYFEKAIEGDPNYALAYAGLADSYITLGAWGVFPQEDILKAKEAAIKALKIDDSLAEAHNALAYTKFIFDWDWQGAEIAFKHAISLNPNYATAHQFYAEYLTAMGRFDEAMREIRRAQELDPLSLIINAIGGWFLVYAREYDQAIEQCQKTLEMDPSFRPAHAYLGRGYFYKGMYKEALAKFEMTDNISGIGRVYAKVGKIQQAKRILEDLKKQHQHSYDVSLHIAALYSYLGDNDQFFTWLERAYEERAFKMAYLKVDPMFDTVRSDSRFTAWLKKMRLD
ncbi:MAG: protein kinase [Candidatus Aminicenantes bacterium]|nr:protein kinase [Candidatus Aminicenantes bacterium]